MHFGLCIQYIVYDDISCSIYMYIYRNLFSDGYLWHTAFFDVSFKRRGYLVYRYSGNIFVVVFNYNGVTKKSIFVTFILRKPALVLYNE